MSDPLGLELQTAGSCYVDGGSRSWVLWKGNECSDHWAVSLAPWAFKSM